MEEIATPSSTQASSIPETAFVVSELTPTIIGWSGFTVAIVAVLAFVAGVLIARKFLPSADLDASETVELRKKLDKSDQQLKKYQQEVSEHFITVSHLTTNVAQSYREINEHLASSAIRLASPEIGRQLLKSGGSDLSLLDSDGNPLVGIEDVEVPRDYAPKVPGGVLSEEYGLAENDAQDNSSKPPSQLASEDQEDSDPTENVN